MSLPPLVTAEDIQRRTFRDLTDAELARVEMLAADASAVVRNYTRCQFTSIRATQRIRPIGYRVRLPHKPVTAVHGVSLIINGSPLPVAGYTWDGTNELWLAGWGVIVNLAETASEWLATHTPVAEVDYTAGYSETPPDVVAVLCSMITRSLAAPAGGAIIQQAVGEYSYQLSEAVVQGPLTMTDAEKAVLAAYRPAGTAVELRW